MRLLINEPVQVRHAAGYTGYVGALIVGNDIYECTTHASSFND